MAEEVELPKQVQDKLEQFESLQQQLQLITLQKQQLMRENSEAENALSELEKLQDNNKNKIYIASGPLFIETNKEESKKKLTSEKEMLDARIKILEKQEKKFTEKLNELRTEVQGLLQNLQKTQVISGG